MPSRLATLLLGLTLAAGCSPPEKEGVSLFAAMSTREAARTLARRYEAETGVPVTCSFASSSTLARQIEQGADADLFLSADDRWADFLQENGRAAKRTHLLANRLVVIVPAGSSLELTGLEDLPSAKIDRLALALDTAPAGRYARQALRHAGVWEALRDKVIEARDVRATLTYVLRGEADTALVYATDAAVTGEVRVALEVPESYHNPIRYPLVWVKGSRGEARAADFAEYLQGDEAAEVFGAAGFVPLP